MTEPSRFPWWIPAGALLLAAAYLPTLRTPFDFIDDGNLVYPAAAGTSLHGHAELWWDKVRANYEHLGPFRPTLWLHWQLQANLFGGDALLWRFHRLLWCALAAGMLLWLFHELGIPPAAALMAGALAMWNPYRNEIWTSLTLAEGVAMPYALFGLIAAKKAAESRQPLPWELGSALAVLIALGCKNTFAALVPVQVALRMWPDGLTLRDAWKANGRRALVLALTLALPAAHFVYFKMHWHPGQYETHGPTLAQLGRILNGLKGAMSLEFLALGIGLAGAAVWIHRDTRSIDAPGALPSADSGSRLNVLAVALLLVVSGILAYWPMSMISGRYAMPGVWGLDILFAMLLARLVQVPDSLLKKAAWVGVCAGLAAVMIACVGKQEKFAARANLLWAALHHVETAAPPHAQIAWMSGDSTKGALNVEEGIHFQWHLYHRGRGDVKIGLFDSAGTPLIRTELPPLSAPADYCLFGVAKPESADRWESERSFAAGYWLNRKRYDCHLGRRAASPFIGAAGIKDQLTDQLLNGLRDPVTAQFLAGQASTP